MCICCLSLRVSSANPRNARQQGLKLKQILDDLDIYKDLDDFEPENEDSLQNWFFAYEEKNSASSAKTYLWVFHSFIKPLRIEYKSCKDFDSERYNLFLDLVNSWIKSMSKLQKK